jgi:DNA-binding LytR/AlgR family response regulator
VSGPTAVIAEDEPIIRREIRKMLSELWPQLTILAEAGDGVEALACIASATPDIVFLDIQMPGLNGMDVAQRLGGRAHIVFITAFDSYAVSAFEQGALDYLVKPVTSARMQLAVERLRGRLGETPADLGRLTALLKAVVPAESNYLRWLTVPQGTELRVVAVEEVSYLRADHKYTTVVTPEGSFLMNASLKEMRQKLDPEVFWQIHRSVIVNVAAIDRIYRTFRGALEVKLKERGELLPVSAAHAHLFRNPR